MPTEANIIASFLEKQMASAGGNNNGGSRNAYEQQQRENIERNKRRLAALNIRDLVNGMEQQGQPRKKQKVR